MDVLRSRALTLPNPNFVASVVFRGLTPRVGIGGCEGVGLPPFEFADLQEGAFLRLVIRSLMVKALPSFKFAD